MKRTRDIETNQTMLSYLFNGFSVKKEDLKKNSFYANPPPLKARFKV